MKNKYATVVYNNKKYIVAVTSKNVPFVIDDVTFKKLPNTTFYISNTYVCTKVDKHVFLHHFVKPYDGITVDHINQIKMDNREANLRYANQGEQNKNQSKRKRNVVLPKECGIEPQDIPTFIWYIKAGDHHGDRWMVEIKNKYTWKTTSSKDLSTKLKFELAKKHLRELIVQQPELFEGHCINGVLNEEGQKLKEEYINILNLAGYEFLDEDKKDYLKEDVTNLSEKEVVLLHATEDITKLKQQPQNEKYDLPKYCYYISENDVKGDGFCVGRLHPKQNGKDWTTTRSKRVQTSEKYKQLLAYLDNKEYQPIQSVQSVQVTEQNKNHKNPMASGRKLSNNVFIAIFKLKNERNVTTQDASDYIKKHFDTNVSRDIISKVWKDEIEIPDYLKETNEYKMMISNNKQRTKKTKFTEDEVSWLKNKKNEGKSLGECAKLFEEKFGKSVTRTYISKLE